MTLESNLRQAIAQGLVGAPTDTTENSTALAVAAYAGDSLLQALQASQDHHKRLKAAEDVAKVEPEGVVVTAAALAAAAAQIKAEDHAQSSLLGAAAAHAEVSPVTRVLPAAPRRGRAQSTASGRTSRAGSTNRRTRRKPERAAT